MSMFHRGLLGARAPKGTEEMTAAGRSRAGFMWWELDAGEGVQPAEQYCGRLLGQCLSHWSSFADAHDALSVYRSPLSDA